jgi:uncharacterized protein (TIGR00299 family) protein
MRIAYFDCFSGASGDMTLGALIDAGGDLERLRAEIAKLDVGPVEIAAGHASQHGIRGTRVTISAPDTQPARTWREIRGLIERSSLSERARRDALRVFQRLAEAEAHVHGTAVESVHFHEVGAIDAIVDICGAAILLEQLGTVAVYASPLRTGSGFVRSAHGLLPVPAPATAALLADARAPVAPPPRGVDPVEAELLTPTGAAILTTLATFESPAYRVESTGYGFGQRELPWPNALRVMIGETRASEDAELLLETNLDDMSPQYLELLMERLFAAGALDVWFTPIVMKKSRPATMVSLLAPVNRREALESVLIENSTTLGVRRVPIERTKAARRMETVQTRWGDVRVKLRGWNGRVIDVAPEYDDCVRIAREADATLREVWNEAHRIAEVYVGRRLSPRGELLVLGG